MRNKHQGPWKVTFFSQTFLGESSLRISGFQQKNPSSSSFKAPLSHKTLGIFSTPVALKIRRWDVGSCWKSTLTLEDLHWYRLLKLAWTELAVRVFLIGTWTLGSYILWTDDRFPTFTESVTFWQIPSFWDIPKSFKRWQDLGYETKDEDSPVVWTLARWMVGFFRPHMLGKYPEIRCSAPTNSMV